MGRQLEQHRQRFIEQGNLVAFLAGFDEALHEDALAHLAATHRIEAIGSRIAALGAVMDGDRARYERLMKHPPAPGPEALTPDVLLAALEPPSPGAVEKREPTLEEAWNTLVHSFDGLWRWMIDPPTHALATIAILSGLLAITIFLAQLLH